MKIVAESLERELIDRSCKPETVGSFAAPGTDEFLALAVIVRCRVVRLGGLGAVLLGDTDHP
jgi:hypothetical protein